MTDSDNIFISYRRGRDNDSAGRLYDRLAAAFGEDRLFRDVDNAADMAGLDFHRHLDERVARCSALVAVIGPGWLDDLPRLRDEGDFVRIEIEAALARKGLRVIPVLVGGAAMPAAGDLPASLAEFARRGAIRLTDDNYSAAFNMLVSALRGAGSRAARPVADRSPPGAGAAGGRATPSVRTPSWTMWIAVAVAGVVVVALGYWLVREPTPPIEAWLRRQ